MNREEFACRLAGFGIKESDLLCENYEDEYDWYFVELKEFLNSYDFMRLGMDISHGHWSQAQIKTSKMIKTANNLGLKDFSRLLLGVRQAAAGKNAAEAKQLLALLVNKRVHIINSIRSIC